MLLFSFYINSSNSNAEDACSNDISEFEQEFAEGPLECRECEKNDNYEGYDNVVGREQPAQSGFLFYCFTADEWKVVYGDRSWFCLATEVEGGLATEVGGGGLSGYGGGVAVLQEANYKAVPVDFGGGDLQVLNEYDGGGLSEVVGDEQETVGSGAGSSFKVGTGSW